MQPSPIKFTKYAMYHFSPFCLCFPLIESHVLATTILFYHFSLPSHTSAHLEVAGCGPTSLILPSDNILPYLLCTIIYTSSHWPTMVRYLASYDDLLLNVSSGYLESGHPDYCRSPGHAIWSSSSHPSMEWCHGEMRWSEIHHRNFVFGSLDYAYRQFCERQGDGLRDEVGVGLLTHFYKLDKILT